MQCNIHKEIGCECYLKVVLRESIFDFFGPRF